jgi:hypothetical protein
LRFKERAPRAPSQGAVAHPMTPHVFILAQENGHPPRGNRAAIRSGP